MSNKHSNQDIRIRAVKSIQFGQSIESVGRALKYDRSTIRTASDFGFETGFWTCRWIIQHCEKKYGIQIFQPTMWRFLRESTMSYQKTEKRYKEADPVAQAQWIRMELPKIKRIARKFNSILYLRMGLAFNWLQFLEKLELLVDKRQFNKLRVIEVLLLLFLQ